MNFLVDAQLPRRAAGWLAGLIVVSTVVLIPLSGLSGPDQRWLTFGAIALATPFAFHAFKDDAFDRWIGELSYPLYLCHLVVIGLVLTFEPPFAAWVAIAGSLAVAAALVMLVEQPVDRYRQRRAARAGDGAHAGLPAPA